MNIQDIQKILTEYTKNNIVSFLVNKDLLEQDANRKGNEKIMYNKLIKDKVEKKHGIYIWENDESKEIIYIGMAGKIKQNGIIGDHSLDQRLKASREQIKINGKNKDITTGKYLLNKMNELKFSKVKFYIVYIEAKQFPPTYVESILLHAYYIKNEKLPILNNAF